MLKKIISFSALAVLTFNISVFAHTATIENSGDSKYKSIRLTPEIYNNANSDLSDILVKNSLGEIVPYFINTGYQVTYNGDYNYPMSLINSYTKDDAFYFDYKVKSLPNRDIVTTSIEMTTKTINFAKNVEIFGSYDNSYWEKIQNDTLYNVDGKTKLNIDFSKPQKYTHYRFKLANNLEKIVFDTVQLKYNVSTSEKSYFIETVTPEFSVEQKDNKTYINVAGLKNLKLADITILSDSIFKRNASTPFGGKEIYNLSFNNSSYLDTTIPLNWKISTDDTFVVTITNNDDRPINIKGISVKYFADEIVFDGSSKNNFELDFGKNEGKRAPLYDIASYKDEILKQNIDKLGIKDIKYDRLNDIEKQHDYKSIFNIVIVIISILLAFLIILKLRKKS